MKRNAIIALIIAVLAMNLPFWQFENRIQLVTGIVFAWMMAFDILVETEKKRGEDK